MEAELEHPPTMWGELDKCSSPFEWPDVARNLYTQGVKCSFDGRSVADMSVDDLMLFVGFLDAEYTKAVVALQEYERRIQEAQVADEKRAQSIIAGSRAGDREVIGDGGVVSEVSGDSQYSRQPD